MFHNLKVDATRAFLFMEIAIGVCFGMVVATNSLYEATVAGLTALQLVLIGTTLEVSTFLFEVPTGIVADVYSRRLSIIIGYLLIGLGFLIEGFFPAFAPIVIANIIWGLGYTFTSGAKQAWITDEIGEEAANKLFLRTARLGAVAWILTLGITAWLGADNIVIPLRVGAIGIILVGSVLAFIMPETGFRPTPKEDRTTWQHMWHVFKQGASAVHAHPRLGNIVFIGLFYGLYSEGVDRLSVKLLLDNFQLPVLFGSNALPFFMLLDVIGAVVYIFVMRQVEKRIDTSSPLAIGRAMLLVTGLITLSLLSFALSPILVLAVISMIAVGLLRGVRGPLQATWVNQKLDSRVRATIHSMFGQVDAIGQAAGGPLIGTVARLYTVRAAVSFASFLLAPALLFIGRANRIPVSEVEAMETVSETTI